MEERPDQCQANAIADNVSCSRFNELAPKGIFFAVINIDALCAKGESQFKGTAREVIEFERSRRNLLDLCVIHELAIGDRSRRSRLIEVASRLDAHYLGYYSPELSSKPGSYLRDAMATMGTEAESSHTVLISNKLIEINYGRLLGMYTILVPAPERSLAEPEKLNSSLTLQNA